MGVFDKFRDMIGIDAYDDDLYDDAEQDVDYETSSYYDRESKTEEIDTNVSSRRHTGNVYSMQEKKVKAITAAFKLVVIEPQGFDECSRLVDDLKSRKPVIVNLEKLDLDLARKIFDFLGGATYALNGNVQKVANNIFVFAPENVAIDAESEHKPYNFTDQNEDYNPWK